jgi:4,5-dihydroxyphthalate decarboxylase
MELTIALNRYDRHSPIFDGSVNLANGDRLLPLEVGESHKLKHGGSRHARMLKNQEFDLAETSLASWIAAVAADPDLPLVGLPIFPRRFFSVGQIYVGAGSTARHPRDLIGKKVGLHSFQTTLSVLAKGDFKKEYGVDWRTIHWICMRPEIVDVDLGPDVKIEWLAPGADIGEMLLNGEIDALMSPEPRKSMFARPQGYRRLFADSPAEELRYFKKYGFFPVMHLIVAKRELIERSPDLPAEVMRVFAEAKRLAFEYYEDSDYSLIVWSRNHLEAQRAVLGEDPWVNGFRANRENLALFLEYAFDQRLTSTLLQPEALFHPSALTS